MNTSPDVPLKDTTDGKSYTDEEIRLLRGRWQPRHVQAIAGWIKSGALPEQVPACISRISSPKGDAGQLGVLDLRGIDMREAFQDGGVPAARGVGLARARLEYSDLSNAPLQGLFFNWAHLEFSKLTSAFLAGADFSNAILDSSDLQFADLKGARLRKASMRKANLSYADLSNSLLVEGSLLDANLEYSDLSGANLIRANIQGANLSNVKLDETLFTDVAWKPLSSQTDGLSLYVNFETDNAKYADPLFAQHVRQVEFIRRCKETWPKPVFWLWKATCDCGRSSLRLLFVCSILVIFFASVFFLSHAAGVPLVKHDAVGGAPSFGATLYATTASFLLYSELAPCNCAGAALVILQSVCGFVALGALISIFCSRVLPPQ